MEFVVLAVAGIFALGALAWTLFGGGNNRR